MLALLKKILRDCNMETPFAISFFCFERKKRNWGYICNILIYKVLMVDSCAKRIKINFSLKKVSKTFGIIKNITYLCIAIEKDGRVAQLDRATAF